MTDPAAIIFSVQKFSTEDGPGIRTTFFFKGCPMRCPWCHNPESIRYEPEVVWHPGRCLGDGGCLSACPAGALRGEAGAIEVDREICRGCASCVAFCPSSALEIHGRGMGVAEMYDAAVRDVAFYGASGGGVTLSGGEPLAQPRPAIALMERLRSANVHVALDTCGAVSEWALRDALPYCNLILFDVKTVDPAAHEQFTGVAFRQVEASARIVAEAGVPVWVRTPVIPGYTADEATIRGIAHFVAARFERCERHDLLAYSNLGTSKYEQLGRPFKLRNAPLLDAARIGQLCEVAREAGSKHARWSGPVAIGEAVK